MPDPIILSQEKMKADKKADFKERLARLECSAEWPAFLEFIGTVEKAVMSRAASTNDGNLDTKTIGILRGLAYCKNPSKFTGE